MMVTKARRFRRNEEIRLATKNDAEEEAIRVFAGLRQLHARILPLTLVSAQGVGGF